MTTFVVKGQAFESDLSDDEAIEALRSNSNRFARSLLHSYNSWGRLSDNQWAWVHKLAQSEQTIEPLETFTNIYDLFRVAKSNGLKTIAVRFENIKFALAGDRSRYAGQIHVTDGKPYGENQYFGRINEEGEFFSGKNFADEILETIRIIDTDPIAVATSHGQSTGQCSFCGRPLTDERSKSVGYGKTCAMRFDLEWGQ